MKRPYYMVLRISERGTHYVLATPRMFGRYSAAELYLTTIPVTRHPIILMID